MLGSVSQVRTLVYSVNDIRNQEVGGGLRLEMK